jgi:hypothetical protein
MSDQTVRIKKDCDNDNTTMEGITFHMIWLSKPIISGYTVPLPSATMGFFLQSKDGGFVFSFLKFKYWRT